MPITLEKAGVALGYGAVDVGFMAVDEARKYSKSFRNVTDWSRIITMGGSLGVHLLRPPAIAPRIMDDLEVLFYASGPKVEESLYELAKTEGSTAAAKLKAMVKGAKLPVSPGGAPAGQQYAPTIWG